MREHDPDGYVQMPGMRILSGAPDGKRWYAVCNGFGTQVQSAGLGGGRGPSRCVHEGGQTVAEKMRGGKRV